MEFIPVTLLMCKKGLSLSCAEARRLIRNGVVVVDGEVVDDTTAEVKTDSEISLKTKKRRRNAS